MLCFEKFCACKFFCNKKPRICIIKMKGVENGMSGESQGTGRTVFSPPKVQELDACLLRVGQGDSRAFSDLYEKTHVAVYAFARSYLKHHDDAQDVAHDCFLKIWQAAPSYRSSGKPMAWILTVTRNFCLMKLRERGRTVPLDGEEDRMADEGLDGEDRLILRECLEGLGEEERQIVILHAVSGLRHREIARLLSLKLSTVLSRYHRAIQKIKHKMGVKNV